MNYLLKFVELLKYLIILKEIIILQSLHIFEFMKFSGLIVDYFLNFLLIDFPLLQFILR